MTDPFDRVSPEDLSARRTLKWTRYPPDVLPVWIADMDLPTPAFIAEVIDERVRRGELGYPPETLTDEVVETFVGRAERTWGWSVDPGRVEVVTDVMTGVCQVIDAVSEPGDEILVPTPVYPPFLTRPTDLGRAVVEVPLRDGDEGATFDVEALDAAVTPRTRLLALVNPHNPTGRVFTRRELVAVADLADRHGLPVVVDEIHADLLHGDAVHVPLASLGGAAARRTFTVTGATKAFNLAGFRCAVVVVPPDGAGVPVDLPPPALRGEVSSLSALTTIEAWTRGDAWLADLRAALTARRDHLAARLAAECPDLGFRPGEATFLAWLDVSRFDLGDDPGARLVDVSGVAPNSGRDFGRAGAGHIRVNVATPWPVLDEAIDRLIRGLRSVGGTPR